jgi:hypothetical protein
MDAIRSLGNRLRQRANINNSQFWIFSVQKTNAIAPHPKRDNNPSVDLERFPIKLSNSPLTPEQGK